MNHESFFQELKRIGNAGQGSTLLGIMLVTLIYNLWGFPFVSMIPVIGKEVMLLNPRNVGLLASAEGLRLTELSWSWIMRSDSATETLCVWNVFKPDDGILFFPGLQYFIAGMLLFISGIGAGCFQHVKHLGDTMFSQGAKGTYDGIGAIVYRLGDLRFVQGFLANWLGAQNAVFICSIQGMVVLIAVVKFIPKFLLTNFISGRIADFEVREGRSISGNSLWHPLDFPGSGLFFSHGLGWRYSPEWPRKRSWLSLKPLPGCSGRQSVEYGTKNTPSPLQVAWQLKSGCSWSQGQQETNQITTVNPAVEWVGKIFWYWKQ